MSSLFGDEAAVPAGKKGKPKSDGAVAEVEARYAEGFERLWHCKAALMPYGKHRRLWREMIDNYGKEEVLRLLDVFFTTRDPVVTRRNYTIVDFHFAAQRLRLNGRQPDDRTAENVDAARRATERR